MAAILAGILKKKVDKDGLGIEQIEQPIEQPEKSKYVVT